MKGRDALVEWMPFELRPEPVPPLRPDDGYLVQTWKHSVHPLAEMLGVDMKLPGISPQPRTRTAFEGYQYARERGLGPRYHDAVMRAFFQHGKDIGRIDVLAGIASTLGLDADDFTDALRRRRYKRHHEAAVRYARDVGVEALPACKIGNVMLVGLKSRHTFGRTIDEQLARGSVAAARS